MSTHLSLLEMMLNVVGEYMICEICKKELKLKGISTHIKLHHNMTIQEYYDKYLKQPNDGICVTCGKPTTFKGLKFGYLTHCCNKCAQLDPKIKEKKAQTCIDRYGVDNVYKSDSVKTKIRTTVQEKYGVDSVLQLDQVREKTYESMQDQSTKDKIQESKQLNIRKFELEHDCTLFNTLRSKYGQGWINLPLERLTLNGHASFIKNSDIPKIIDCVESNSSSFEREVKNYIKSIYSGEIIFNTRKVISPLELDIYIPDKHLAIECNGTFWHSSLNECNKNYHYNKSLECQKLGIRLIHIYEYEWFVDQDKIKQLLNISLGHLSKIYARQCEVKIINNAEAKPFNEATHLQGHRAAQITYGLFYNNQLVQLMSFSKTRYNRNLKNDNEWEIIRGCPGSNNIVVGGVSKLFKHFVKDYKPSKVFSYCDFNKFDGKSYEVLGMTCTGYTGPNKWWVIGNDLVPRNPKKYAEYKAKARGILWGAGSKKYEITFTN